MKLRNYLFKRLILNIVIINLALFSSQVRGQQPSEILDTLYNWTLPSVCLYGCSEWAIGSTCSDIAEVGGDSPQDNLEIQQLATFDIKATNPQIREYYTWNYQNIYWCNVIEFKLMQIPELSPVEQRIYAEARFFRSLSYFNLVRLFGGVPIYTETDIILPDSVEPGPDITENNVADIWKSGDHFIELKARNTVGQIWELIDSELDSAIIALPLRSELTPGEKYRITKGTAQTLMAKSKLYQQQWQEALDYAEAVISSNEYQLESNYADIFSLESEHGPESIFELEQYYVWQIGSPLPDRKLFIWACHNAYNNPRFFDINPDMPDNIELQNDAEFMSYWGWGFNCPVPAYVSSFQEGDPRKNFTVLEKNDSLVWASNINDTVYYAVFDPASTEYTEYFHGEPSPTAHFFAKYFVSYDDYQNSIPLSKFNDFWSLQHEGGLKNIRVFRYADVLLMASEAALHLEDTGKALDYVNMIRARARNSGLSGAPHDLTSISLDDIYNERKWELGLEGHRYFDLIRTGMAYDVLNNMYSHQHDINIYFDTTRHYLYPIPIQDIIDSKGLINQNPGYISWDSIGEITQIKPLDIIEWEVDTNGSKYVSKTVLLNEYFDFSEYNIELYPLVTASFSSDLITYLFGYSYTTKECNLFIKSDLDKLTESYTDTVIINISNHKEEITDTFELRINLTGSISSIDLQDKHHEIIVYPNPSKNNVRIMLPDNITFPVNTFIYSAQGRLLITKQVDSSNMIIDITGINDGIYLLYISELAATFKLAVIR